MERDWGHRDEDCDGAPSLFPEDGAAIGQDRRWALRRGISLDADITDAAGGACAARVTDISEDGCMIRTLSGCDLDRNLLHEIKITGLEPLGAYVIWSDAGNAGLAFAKPLHTATVRSLVTKSLYARLSRRLARGRPGPDDLGTLRPFPFKD